MLTIEKHGGVVFLTLTNNDETIEVDSSQELAHGVNRSTIGTELVALTNERNGANRSRFGSPHKLKSEVAIGVSE
jgi:hypothetical protein